MTQQAAPDACGVDERFDSAAGEREPVRSASTRKFVGERRRATTPKQHALRHLTQGQYWARRSDRASHNPTGLADTPVAVEISASELVRVAAGQPRWRHWSAFD